MTIQLNPYLNFRDQTRPAMEFYESVFGGKLSMQTYKDFHASEDPTEQDKIMHAQLTTEKNFVIMAADVPNNRPFSKGDNGFSISLSGDDEPLLRGYYEKLSNGGTITMPLEKAQWGDIFGMVTDKFGISWLVNIGNNANQNN